MKAKMRRQAIQTIMKTRQKVGDKSFPYVVNKVVATESLNSLLRIIEIGMKKRTAVLLKNKSSGQTINKSEHSLLQSLIPQLGSSTAAPNVF